MKIFYVIVVDNDKEDGMTLPVGSIIAIPELRWHKFKRPEALFIELKDEPQLLNGSTYPKLRKVLGPAYGPETILVNARCELEHLFWVPEFRDPVREMLESRLFMKGEDGSPGLEVRSTPGSRGGPLH